MPFRILSLDGGGIRGIVAARILAAIERQINKPLNQYFNLIAGTSTGSILAAAVATGRSSEEIVELYKHRSSIIFPYKSRFTLRRIPLLLRYGLSAPKFSDEGLIKVFKDVFGSTALFDLDAPNLPKLLIISYDTIQREAIFFKSWRRDKGYGNVPLWEVCVCSASAPTYFPAHKLERRVNGFVQQASSDFICLDEVASSINDVYQNMQIRITNGTGSGQTRNIKKYLGTERQVFVNAPWDILPDNTSTYSIKSYYSAIDGGVAANNPSACAIAEALRFNHKPENISVLSIGTGERTRAIPFEKAENWGLVQWAQPIIGVLFDASSGVFEYISEQILHDRFLRLQFKLDRQLTGERLSDDIDDVSPENINNLIKAADTYIQQPHIQKSIERFLQNSQ